MRRNSIGYKALSLALLAASLAACTSSATPPQEGPAPSPSTLQPIANVPVIVTDGDDDADWKQQTPTYVELKGNTASVNGANAGVKGNQILILSAGVYVISGKLDNGQIVVDAQNKGTVRLVLNGAEIHSKDSAPIEIKKADKTNITLADGTKNAVSDVARQAAAEGEANAAIFSKGDLTISGTGALLVRGNNDNGIMSKDDLTITSGEINVYAVDDALVGRDLVHVKAGTIRLEAGGDGIKTTNDTDAAKGHILLAGGTYDLKTGADGVQATQSLQITGGTYTIVTNGGSVNGVVRVAETRPMGRPGAGGPQTPPAPAAPTTPTTASTARSAKAVKATDLLITGGTFHIDSADDAIHGNNSVTISNGDITITSGDDGVHADASIRIEGGKVNITKSYEGIESKLVTIAGGEIHVVASDDGINLAGGADGSSVNGRPGQNTFSPSAGDNALHINGGYVSVDAMGDGVDANGSIYMTDGTLVVHGPTANNNGPVDYDRVFEMTGGFLVAAGSSGMAQAPSPQSTQNSLLMSFSTVQQAGVLVSLQDSQGKPVVTFAPRRQYQSVVVASPALKKDATLTFYSGGTASGTATDGLYASAMYQGGTKLVSFPVINSVTYLTESGVSTTPPRGMSGPRR